jgi:3-hydroxyacyl-CoA dehydrogenase
MARDVRKVVVLGANGAMGAGSGEVFAAAGIPVVFLARTRDKAREGQKRAEKMAKSEAISRFISVGSYDEDLEREVADADLIFEAVSEELSLKKVYFERIDKVRKPDSIVGTVSSGLSIAAMTEGRTPSFAKHFLGIHFFNPPNVIIGCELIPHKGTDPDVTAFVSNLLSGKLGRELVQTTDTPAFCGNRVGFKVLNECAQLAEEHGVAYIDALIGPHTGRAMAPLATIDFVGWDVHKAIVDNLRANTRDEANATFVMPAYMNKLVAAGHLGDKTPALGGFVKRTGKGKDAQIAVLDPKRADYSGAPSAIPDIAARMKRLHRVGRYREAFDVFAEATGPDATLMRKVILGYVSYGLGRVGDVVERAADVDRIMGFGFNWAPPSVLVDVIGARRAVKLIEAAKLPVPKVVAEAAEKNANLFDEPHVDIGRFFQA